jgi:hypothetical protein
MACEKTDAKLRLLTVLSICLCLMPTPAATQSLRDLARQQGGTAATHIGADFGYMSPTELMSRSDLVLQGRIVDAKLHLGPDESYVVTDYTIAPIRVVKQKRPTTTARPGETTEIIVRRVGGQVTEGNLQFSTTVNVYPESESFKVGEEIVVFLQFDMSERVYVFANGPFSAFRVQSGRVQPMTQRAARAPTAMPKDKDVTSFIDELVRLSR